MRGGLPEVMVLAMFAVVWLLPVAAGIWALVTLKQLRDGQRAVEIKLESIAQLLRR